MYVIKVEDLGKRYILQQSRRYLIKEAFEAMLGKKNVPKEFWALRHLDFEIQQGESVGIIGENGAGKTTLLRLLSNVAAPTEGKLRIRGRLSSLLELGAGFHPLLTGRENIFLNGTILGYNKRFIKKHLDAIIDFSGIEHFIDEPVKNYSSGMFVRLGFAIASQLEPTILIVDEVLAVGDEEFQRRCKQWIRNYLATGRTLLLVTHDMSLARDICSTIYWLKDGKVHLSGGIEEVTGEYLTFASQKFGITTLTNGALSIIFENGKLIIFWKGIELTKNACCFADLMAANSWQNSMEAKWTIEDASDDMLIVKGYWKMLPIRQRWKVTLETEHRISWSVQMEFLKDIKIEKEAFTIMLTELFTRWFTNSEKGDFPAKFDERFGTRIIAIDNNEGIIGAKTRSDASLQLPDISFEIVSPKKEFLPQVTNTAQHLSSRTLEYSRIKADSHCRKGEKHFFKGIIHIGNNLTND